MSERILTEVAEQALVEEVAGRGRCKAAEEAKTKWRVIDSLAGSHFGAYSCAPWLREVKMQQARDRLEDSFNSNFPCKAPA